MCIVITKLCIFKAKTKTMQLCVFIKRHIALTIHYKNNVAVSPKTKPCFPFSLLSPNILASIQLFSFWSCHWNPFSPFDKNVNKALLPLWPNVHESLWNNRVCLMLYIKGQKTQMNNAVPYPCWNVCPFPWLLSYMFSLIRIFLCKWFPDDVDEIICSTFCELSLKNSLFSHIFPIPY